MFNYDFPLSPKGRIYLKFENVFKRIEETSALNSVHETMCLVRALLDYVDLVDGAGSIKIELLKDLDKCDLRLQEWEEDPEADGDFVRQLCEQIVSAKKSLDGFTRQRNILQNNPVIESIKPRFMTPCGVNCFDTPLFEFWIHLSKEERLNSVKQWLHELDCLRIPISTLLYLWRLCADSQRRVAKMGFLQEPADECDLINIRYPDNVRGYPVVSGFQSRVNIRFLPYEKGAPVGDITFDIAYIKGSI